MDENDDYDGEEIDVEPYEGDPDFASNPGNEEDETEETNA